MDIEIERIWLDIQIVKRFSPLVHNITNYVVMEQTANALLACGASPIMAHALEEVEEMTSKSNALVLNIGTLSPSWVAAMELALKAAQKNGIPIVLDPVGAGGTKYRTETAKRLLKLGAISVVRGNAAEISALAQEGDQEDLGQIKGTDSQISSYQHQDKAKKIALTHQNVIWMSGETDIVTDGKRTILIHNGHPIMTKVTGMGGIAAAITGALLAVNPDYLMASVHAAILMGIAGEIAAFKSNGPGLFLPAFFDALYLITKSDLNRRIKVEVA